MIQVLSEGVGGNVQIIGTYRLNLAKYVASYGLQPTITQFNEALSYPTGGLVGDLEVQVNLK